MPPPPSPFWKCPQNPSPLDWGLGMAMRIYLPMRIDADICFIRHISDIARYMRLIFRKSILSASAWPSLILTILHGRRFVLDLSSWFLINISYILKGARPSWRPRLALRKKSCSLPETSDSSADVLGSSLDPINTQLYNVILFFCYLC